MLLKAKIFTPAVTIFHRDGSFDWEGNRKVVDHLVRGGVDGIVPLGSTGEFPGLPLEARKKFLAFYVEAIGGRVELLLGTGSNNFEETLDLSRYALSLGVKGVLILPPYYYALSQEEGVRWYAGLAERLNGDVFIYNFKARSGFDMAPETVVQLATKYPNIKGMKDSTDSIAHTKAVLAAVFPERPDFEVYSGFDDHFLPNIAAGGSGCIAALSNMVPELWSRWTRAVRTENFAETFRIQKKIDCAMPLYSIQSNFALIFKKLMADNGLDIGTTCLFPFDEIKEEVYRKAQEIYCEAFKTDGRC